MNILIIQPISNSITYSGIDTHKIFKQMKKIIYILFGLITLSTHSQVINQDANGFSTIVLKSANLNLDITNNIATFTYYDYIHKKGKTPEVEETAWMLGGDVKGTAENGSGALFSNEKLVANAFVGGFVGFKWYSSYTKNSSRVTRLQAERNQSEAIIINTLSIYNMYLDELKTKGISDRVVDTLRSDINSLDISRWKKTRKKLEASDALSLDALGDLKVEKDAVESVKSIYEDIYFLLLLQGDPTDVKKALLDLANLQKVERVDEFLDGDFLVIINENLQNIEDLKLWNKNKKKISDLLDSLIFQYEIKNEGIAKELLKKYDDAILQLIQKSAELTIKLKKVRNKIDRYFFHKIYARGGFNGVEFKYDLNNDSTAINDRFVDKTFNGWEAELGYNINYKGYNLFGISAKAAYANNLSGLEDTEYTFGVVDTTVTNGQLSNSRKIKAFSGTFDSFYRFSFNFDYVRLIPLKDDKKGISNIYLTINPYIRHHIYDNSDKLKNNTVTGLGVNFVNSDKQRIMGGLFVQTNDVFGVHANEDSALGKRISVGLVAKFAFSGLGIEKKSK